MAECLSGQASERWIALKAEEGVIHLDCNDDVMALPLGRLYGVDDAWRGGWGPSVEDLKTAVRAACVEQVQPETRCTDPRDDAPSS